MASVKLLLRIDKINDKGTAPLYLRIIKDRKVKYIALGILLKLSEWNDQTGKVRKSHPNSGRINAFIAQKEADAEEISLEMQSKSKTVSSHKIKERILGKAAPEFFPYAENWIKALRRSGRIGTFRRAKSVVEKLKQYINGKSLSFDDLTVTFLIEYEDHLSATLKNKTNTVHSNLKTIRTILNNAAREDLISIETNPFNRYKLKSVPSQRAFLTEEEIAKLEKLELTPSYMINHHRNAYIFACYAGGLRVSDVLTLRWNQFDGESINLKIHKTKKPLSIKLPNKALQLIKNYDQKGTVKESFIFPLIKLNPSESDPQTIFNAISSATAYANKDLKKLAQLAGIEKPLSFHTSRHTFATMALRRGMRIEYVSKLMGHADIQETQVYVKIVNSELDKAMVVTIMFSYK
jgi:integrase/recombinase XerD